VWIRIMWKCFTFDAFSISVTVSFVSWRVMLIGGGLFPLAVAGASVCSSAVSLVGCLLNACPPCGVAGEGMPFGSFGMICRACDGVCFDDEVVVCLPDLPRSISFFLFIASTIEFGVVYAFDGPGCGCDLLESWYCNSSNLFLIGILEKEAVFVGFMISLFPVFSSWVGSLFPSKLSWLPSNSLVLVTRFGCGLSFRVFCAESFRLLMSIVVFYGIIFLLIALFVEFMAGSAFLLSVSLSLSPIFLFIIVIPL
jgi:hypothetical protein